MKVFVGKLIHCKYPERKDGKRLFQIQVVDNAALGVNDSGEIVFLKENPSDQYLSQYMGNEKWEIVKLLSNQFLMPGLVDTHIHAPQYCFTGTGYDKQLLDWLDTYTFPTEKKFDNLKFAKETYTKVVKRTLSHGTTTASYLATIHLHSTKELCKIIASQGQRALVGKYNKDYQHSCPKDFVHDTETSYRETVEFIEFVEGMNNPLIQAVITPTFAIACTYELMKRLGQLAVEKNVRIQTHLCEQLTEIDKTMSLFPEFANYTDVYDQAGLVTDKSYFAHCVHLNEDEIKILKKRNAGIAHCPNSNICLRSGLMDSQRYLQEEIKVGLGTDIAGGYHPSVFDAMRMSITVSKSLQLWKNGGQNPGISHHEAFYMATLGGAQVLNLDDTIGNFEVGKQFDALLIDALAPAHNPVFDIFEQDSFEDILSKFLYLGDDRNIIKVFVKGREVVNKM